MAQAVELALREGGSQGCAIVDGVPPRSQARTGQAKPSQAKPSQSQSQSQAKSSQVKPGRPVASQLASEEVSGELPLHAAARLGQVTGMGKLFLPLL